MKKKICFITLFIVLFAFIIGTQCFATQSNYGFYYDGDYRFLSQELVDKYDYFLIVFYDDTYYLYCSKSEFFYATDKGNYLKHGENNIFTASNSSLDSLLSLTVAYSTSYGGTTGDSFLAGNPSKASNDVTLISSNFNLLDENDNVVVWSNSSSTSNSSGNFVSSNYLSQVFTSSTLSGVLNEIVTLLPIVIPVLIGFIAIRKGLAFIFRILRKS